MRRLILLLCFIPTVLEAQRNYPGLIDSYMQAQSKFNEFAGTVLVAKKGKIIYVKAFGLADREWKTPNTIKTKFQVGSLTKQFTASCILQLAEQGKLNLDDKLSLYFPDFPKADSVTIHMLLNHSSGIKNYTELQEFWKIATLPVEKDTLVALFKNQPYNFSPGTKFSYSNSGYFLLGYVIEKITGDSYDDYLFKNVIQKAGLKNTFVGRLDTILLYRARGYSIIQDGKLTNANLISNECAYSAGALISTVEDLYHWTTSLFSYKIISPSALMEMTTPYKGSYGYGLRIDSFKNHFRIWHSGGVPGFGSHLASFPSDSIVVAGISNSGNPSIASVVNALAAILFDVDVIKPYKHKEVMMDTARLDYYTGTYREASGSEITIRKKQGKLLWQTRWGRVLLEFQLKPESSTVFFVEGYPDVQFEFYLDNKGKVIKANSINAGVKNEIVKIF